MRFIESIINMFNNKNFKFLRMIDHNRILNKIWTQHLSHATLDFYIWLLSKNAIIIHASSVVVSDKCFVFLGNSGLGKTTMAKLFYHVFGTNTVLNDDLIIVQQQRKHILVYGTPWIGKKTHLERSMKSAMSSAQCISSKTHHIYFFHLGQSKRNMITKPLSESIKIKVFIQAVLGNHVFLRHDFVDLTSADILDSQLIDKSKKAYRQSIKLVKGIVNVVPLRKLYFKNTKAVVDYLLLWSKCLLQHKKL